MLAAPIPLSSNFWTRLPASAIVKLWASGLYRCVLGSWYTTSFSNGSFMFLVLFVLGFNSLGICLACCVLHLRQQFWVMTLVCQGFQQPLDGITSERIPGNHASSWGRQPLPGWVVLWQLVDFPDSCFQFLE